MNNLQIRKLNKYQAEKALMTDNAAAFPAGSPGARSLMAVLVTTYSEHDNVIPILSG